VNILHLIVARGGSKGIPGKNLREIGGISLIGFKAIAAQKSKNCTRLIISTDSAAIQENAKFYNVEVPFTRPAALATDNAKTEDVIMHAIEYIENNEGRTYDAIMLLEPSSPFLRFIDVDLAVKMMLEKSHPVFYLIADKRKVAVIEVAPGGETSIGTTENGVLFHTNHYLDEKLLRANETTGKSSLARLNRIRNLLNDHPLRYTVEDFITFSEDAVDGPDDSIWRTGGTPGKERTLASWIIFMPKNGAPELYIKFANPEEPVRVYNMKLDTPFWTEGIN